jgi:NAD(P)H-dependent flavin oxidoreductase YrpB (nitropropane dioxygenase family)
LIATRFTTLVGCTAPIQLAGMGSVATPELAAAVTNAGGLGMMGVPMLPAAAVSAMLDRVGKLANGPIGLTFLMPFLDLEAVDAGSSRARVIEFFYAAPEKSLVERVHRAGSLASWQVGSLEEAIAAERAGCDFVVAQGDGAGGHVRGTISLLPLLSQVLDAVRVPVIAAGGIARARDVAAVLAAGAEGVRVGTRFVAAAEADTHPAYCDALIGARAEDTVFTEAYSVGWPDAPHRVLRSAIAAAEDLPPDTVVGETPIGDALAPIPRFGVYPPNRGSTGRIEAMALYAGESVSAVKRVEPAAAIVRELIDGAEALLRARA